MPPVLPDLSLTTFTLVYGVLPSDSGQEYVGDACYETFNPDPFPWYHTTYLP